MSAVCLDLDHRFEYSGLFCPLLDLPVQSQYEYIRIVYLAVRYRVILA